MRTDRRHRIFLVGFMGSGKTTVGERLARDLGFRFIDLDREIEARRGLSIAAIFEKDGEPEFRRLETIALRDAGAGRDVVIATGGGTLTRPENLEFVRAHGITAWLDAPLEVMLDRCRDGVRRPLLGPHERMAALLEKRLPGYRTCDLHMDTEGRSPEQVARQIAARLETLL
jgi:shikimate kinase